MRSIADEIAVIHVDGFYRPGKTTATMKVTQLEADI